jgi:hypothetical protein
VGRSLLVRPPRTAYTDGGLSDAGARRRRGLLPLCRGRILLSSDVASTLQGFDFDESRAVGVYDNKRGKGWKT